MGKAIVWGPMGSILQKFDTVEEAEEWIEECDYAVIYRDTKGGDTNIMVAGDFA